VVSRNVEFDEEATWNWDAQEEKNYDFLPYLKEEEKDQETTNQDAITPYSPPPLAASHVEEESTSERPRKTRDKCDTYERSNEVPCNLEELYCLQIDCKPFEF